MAVRLGNEIEMSAVKWYLGLPTSRSGSGREHLQETADGPAWSHFTDKLNCASSEI